MRRRAFALVAATGVLAGNLPALAAPEGVEVTIAERFSGARLEVRDRGAQRHLLMARAGRVQDQGRSGWVGALSLGTPRAKRGFALELPTGERAYPGCLVAMAEGDRLVLADRLPLETYVASVVTSELPSTWPIEALEAQAVLARTLALRGGRHPAGRLCDLTHCQVFSGRTTPQALRASQATAGEVLSFHGAPIQPLYHSTCGDHLAANATVFGGLAVPYLVASADPYCAASPHRKAWRVHVRYDEVARALGLAEVREVRIADADPAGWAAQVTVDGRAMTGYRLWQALGRSLGWGVVKSVRFAIAPAPDGIVLSGRGLGHGVGMCQWGARGRALNGMDHRRILAAYFPGTVLEHRP